MDEGNGSSSGHSKEHYRDELSWIINDKNTMPSSHSRLSSNLFSEQLWSSSSPLRGRGASWTGYDIPRQSRTNAFIPERQCNSDFNWFEHCAASALNCSEKAELQTNCIAQPLHWTDGRQTEEINFLKETELCNIGINSKTIKSSPVKVKSHQDEIAKELLVDVYKNEPNIFNGNNDCIDLVADPDPQQSKCFDDHYRMPLSHNDPVSLKPTQWQNSECKFRLDPEFQSLRTESLPYKGAAGNCFDSFNPNFSLSRSIIQQCSDMNEIQDYSKSREHLLTTSEQQAFEKKLGAACSLEYYDSSNSWLQEKVQSQEELLHQNEKEIKELREANQRQSNFIKKMLSEKRLLEEANREQTRIIMSQNSSSSSPVANNCLSQPSVSSSSPSRNDFNIQVYEAQLAAYKEDFETESKERRLLQSSMESLKEQLNTAVRELNLAKNKLSKAEQDLRNIPGSFSYKQNFSASVLQQPASNTERVSSSSSGLTHTKTPVYTKPGELESDREINNCMRLNETNLIRTKKSPCFEQIKDSTVNSQELPSWINQPMDLKGRILAY